MKLYAAVSMKIPQNCVFKDSMLLTQELSKIQVWQNIWKNVMLQCTHSDTGTTTDSSVSCWGQSDLTQCWHLGSSVTDPNWQILTCDENHSLSDRLWRAFKSQIYLFNWSWKLIGSYCHYCKIGSVCSPLFFIRRCEQHCAPFAALSHLHGQSHIKYIRTINPRGYKGIDESIVIVAWEEFSVCIRCKWQKVLLMICACRCSAETGTPPMGSEKATSIPLMIGEDILSRIPSFPRNITFFFSQFKLASFKLTLILIMIWH